MNIATLFRNHFKEDLLFDVGQDKIIKGKNILKLYADVSCISHSLTKNNIGLNDNVLILSSNNSQTLIMILAVFNIGAIAIPVNPNIGNDALNNIIKNQKPKCCVFEDELNHQDVPTLETTCSLYISIKPTIVLSHPSSSERSSGKRRKSLSFQELLETGDKTFPFGHFKTNHPALRIHTSGSQGNPKVIQYSHENLFYYFHYHNIIHTQFTDSNNFNSPQKPLLSAFHPSHLASLSIALQGLLMRRPTYLMPEFIPSQYTILLSALNCRLAILVPSMYQALLQEKELLKKYNYNSLELCAVVGESCPDSLLNNIEKTFNAHCFSGYGLTECLPGIAHTINDLQKRSTPRGSSGKLLFEEAKLINDKDQESSFGELWIRNPTVHHCYTDNFLNKEKFEKDGWLKTGDNFYRDNQGYFFHKGRIDDMFVCNGKNIYPKEIEKILLQYIGITNVIAAAVYNPYGKSIPAILVQSQKLLSKTNIIDYFLNNGPVHATPKFIKITKQFPELGPGKINRRACQALLQEHYQASFDKPIRCRQT